MSNFVKSWSKINMSGLNFLRTHPFPFIYFFSFFFGGGGGGGDRQLWKVVVWERGKDTYMVSWGPEGCYKYSKMYHWEPEGRYCCTMSMARTPIWFSTEHLWIVIAPFWLSTEHLWIVIAPFWLSTDDISYIKVRVNMIRNIV